MTQQDGRIQYEYTQYHSKLVQVGGQAKGIVKALFHRLRQTQYLSKIYDYSGSDKHCHYLLILQMIF